MPTSIGNKVHIRYKDNYEWKIKGIAELDRPEKYRDEKQANVSYDPKILLLEGNGGRTALWFNYRISSDKTGEATNWGEEPPILEEHVLLELMKKAIRYRLLSEDFLKALESEIRNQTDGRR